MRRVSIFLLCFLFDVLSAQNSVVYVDLTTHTEVGWSNQNYAHFAFPRSSVNARNLVHLMGGVYPSRIVEIDSLGLRLRVWLSLGIDSAAVMHDAQCVYSLGCDSVTCSYLVTDIKDISYELGEMSLAPNPTNGLVI